MDKMKSYYILLFFNALMSLLFILFNAGVSSIYFFFSLIVFITILIKNRDNIIFFIRTFFLGIIGFLAFGVKLIDIDALYGYHLIESQTFNISMLMFLLTNIALFTSEIGFLISSKIKIDKKKIVFENKDFFYVVWGLLLFVGFLIINTSPLIFGGHSYGDGSATSPALGNLNTISNILFYTLILLYYKFKDIYHWNINKLTYILIFSALYLFVYGEFLRGVRMDAINGLFGTAILIMTYNNKKLNITPKLFLVGTVSFIFVQIIGMIRSALNFLTTDELLLVIKNGFLSLFEGTSSGILFYQGTINDIATTFSGVIMLLEHHVIDFYHGSSYFDYILRTPPEFLYPGGPQDLAWIFANNGYSSGGGFFELAEAYLNFGVVGIFIIPFIISFIFGYAYKLFIYNKYSIIHSMLLFSLLATFMRGILYQTFALYKAIVTGFILVAIFYVIIYLIKLHHKKGIVL